ncbi:hypothetical protein SeLEV6574_g07675, partial [Synchytrium endobioticum]
MLSGLSDNRIWRSASRVYEHPKVDMSIQKLIHRYQTTACEKLENALRALRIDVPMRLIA